MAKLNVLQTLFLNDLKKLLEKHSILISAKDEWQGYPETGESIRITVEFPDFTDVVFGEILDQDTIERRLTE